MWREGKRERGRESGENMGRGCGVGVGWMWGNDVTGVGTWEIDRFRCDDAMRDRTGDGMWSGIWGLTGKRRERYDDDR